MKQQKSLKNIVYQSILEGILCGEYKPDQIINEQELVQKYGYSKTPIREALVALCNEHVLKSFPRYGYQVVSLSRDYVTDILDFRLMLEGGCLKKSFCSLTKSHLDELRAVDLLCQKDTDSFWEHWEANTAFHLKLLSFSKNEYAYQELDRSMKILKRAYAQFYWQNWNHTNAAVDIAHHTKIIDNIAEQNLEQALICLKEDLEDFCI